MNETTDKPMSSEDLAFALDNNVPWEAPGEHGRFIERKTLDAAAAKLRTTEQAIKAATAARIQAQLENAALKERLARLRIDLMTELTEQGWTPPGEVPAAPVAKKSEKVAKPLTDDEIEAGRRHVFSIENPFCPCDRKTMRKAVWWAERTLAKRWGVKLEGGRSMTASIVDQPVRNAARDTGRDRLDMAYINSLPHPLWDGDWLVYDIDVETGLYRIDACGLLEVRHIDRCHTMKDSTGKVHYTGDFELDPDKWEERTAPGATASAADNAPCELIQPTPAAPVAAPGTSPGEIGAWVSTDERMPEEGQSVAFVVRACNRLNYLNGKVLGGYYSASGFGGFSVPGMTVDAWYWMPLPAPPCKQEGGK